MSYCAECGTALADGAEACAACGAAPRPAPTATAAPAPTTAPAPAPKPAIAVSAVTGRIGTVLGFGPDTSLVDLILGVVVIAGILAGMIWAHAFH